MQGISLKRDNVICIRKTPRISLSCKLVPLQYQEHENGLLTFHQGSITIMPDLAEYVLCALELCICLLLNTIHPKKFVINLV